MKKTSEIATEYKALKEDDYKAFILNADGFINEYKDDERAQVKKYIASLEKRILAINKEKERMQFMFTFERKYSDYQFVCGVDEVGRGPLAGPVVAGAVILPKDCDLLYLNDSKQLSEKKREELFEKIMESAVATGLGYGSPELIDDINILQADYVAMREAISKLGVKPDVLLNDAVTIPEIDTLQVPIIKGDAKSASIAAASIIAKVTRDKMMVEYAKVFPEYGFDSNKGYGSAKHIEAIKTFGPTPIHRKSFIKNFI